MKIDIIPAQTRVETIVVAPRQVTITMSEKEAGLLKRIAQFHYAVPALVGKNREHMVGPLKMLLTAIFDGLAAQGIRSAE